MKEFFSALVAPVAGIFQKREERKTAEVNGKNKIALAKQKGETEITLTDQEWEAIAVSKQDSSWKDEYVTIVITSPIVLIIVGSLVAVFSENADGTPDTRILSAVSTALKSLSVAGVDMGYLMNATVLAALGLKVWRGGK